MAEQPTEEDQIRAWHDQEARKQNQDYKLGNRRTPLSNNVLMLLGDLLQPQTMGLDHINMDMSFTNLDFFDLSSVENSSYIIAHCRVWGLLRPLFIERNKLATKLISKRSFQAKSMELFTNTVSTQKQEFLDNTQKKTGFARIFGRKKEEM